VARPRFVCLALALVTLLAYLPARRHGFILYDDPDYLTENRSVQDGLTPATVRWAFTTFHASNWHPLTWLSHALDCELFGLDPGAHHLVSALFHAVNAALLLLVLLRFTGELWPSAVAAALFALHPLRVESVAWAAERKDVLSATFFLLTLWAYGRCVEARNRGVMEWWRSGKGKSEARNQALGIQPSTPLPHSTSAPRFYALSLFFFALGLMSKPMLVTTPFVLLLLDFWPLRRVPSPQSIVSSLKSGATRPDSDPRTTDHGLPAVGPAKAGLLTALQHSSTPALHFLWEKAPFFVLSAASCWVTFLAQRSEAVVQLEPYPVSLRLANSVVSYGRYLSKTVWPSHLAIVYPLVRHVEWSSLIASGVVLAGLTWLAWGTRRTKPYRIVGWLWFLGMLVPVIGLVQVGGQAMADRYTYLPQIGLFVAATFEVPGWAARLRHGWKLPSLAAAVCLAGFLALTENQLRHWQNSELLFSHAVEATGDNPIARINLGVAFEAQGRRPEALRQYEAAVALDPNLAQGQNNLANLLDQSGRAAEARDHYLAALRLKPNAPLVHDNFGTLLVKTGKLDEGLKHYAAAMELDPNDPRPHYLTAKALWGEGQCAAAAAQFQEALRRDGNHVPSLVYYARMLASDPAAARDGAKAVGLAQRANELTGGDQGFVLDTLAMALAEAGRFEEARQTETQALEHCPADDQDSRAAMQQRLLLYQSAQPYRELRTNAPSAGQASRPPTAGPNGETKTNAPPRLDGQ
jgi:tetratricopeptide (TPR) repeat protein